MTTELYLEGGANRYVVVNEQERHLQLECVWFCESENLGDQIFCTREGQKIWVSKYHSDHYVREDVSLYEAA